MNPKKLKKLKAEWDQKLKDDGFKDIEQTIGNQRVLSQRASNAYRQATTIEREAKQEYYRLLTQYTAQESFDNEADKIIMERRSNGTAIVDISKELKRLGFPCHKQTIRYHIRRYENHWGIKKWLPHQLTS